MADRRRIGAALVAALLVTGLAPTAALAVAPIDGGPITIYPVTINDSAGDQYDPHIDGDLATYTAENKIRFYDFFTGDDRQVPSTLDAQDLLSDVDNGQIAFSRISAVSTSILVYEVAAATTTEVNPQGSVLRYGAGIGGDTVAYIDYLATGGELFVTRLGGSSTRATTDARTDQSPQVGPSGDLVVWESCGGGVRCDIHQLGWSGSAWLETDLTSDSAEHNPDTDGSTVVYDALRGSDVDICWQPVGGGAEQCLNLPGEQRNPSIRGGLVAFESIAAGDAAADLFVYQVSSNRLFRITTTPADDSLNDITVLPDGRGRVVWSTGGVGDRDVYGATFELPPVGPTYSFGGFASPIDAIPTLNLLKAGAAVPVKFSLSGDQGLAVFAAGYPKSQSIACDATAPVDGVEETVSAGGSSLTYDSTTGLYAYVWKTDRAWAGTCRQLVLKFADGSTASANFKFK